MVADRSIDTCEFAASVAPSGSLLHQWIQPVLGLAPAPTADVDMSPFGTVVEDDKERVRTGPEERRHGAHHAGGRLSLDHLTLSLPRMHDRNASVRRVGDHGEIGRRRLDRQLARQREQVAVTRNQDGVLVGRERDQVVVPRIDAAYRPRCVGVSREQGRTRQPCHERLSVARRYEALQFRIRQSATELGKKSGRDD